MRVPNINTYYTATYRLGNLTEDLKNANEVISTQKRINEISDDPLGLSQVLSLRNSIGNLEQIEQNVVMGKSWLEGVEASLDSVNNLILDAKSEVSRLANDSTTADERQNAVGRIEHIVQQIVSLGNTQVNGNYIFGGTRTDTVPLTYDAAAGQVQYNGTTTPFEVRTDKNSGVQVGRNGRETFWDNTIEINATNNTLVFKEDNGHGPASQKVMETDIPAGIYTKQGLTTAVRNALNDASARDGYGAEYQVDYDENTREFSIREDGTYKGYLRTNFMWDTGEQAYINNIQTSSQINPDDLDIAVLNKNALVLATPEPAGTEPFTLLWDGKGAWHVQNNPGYVIPAKIEGTADSLDIDLDESGFADITIRLDKKTLEGESISFEIIPEKKDASVGHEMGFSLSDLTFAPPVSDNNPVYVTDLTINAGVNDTIDFVEINATGGVSTTLSAIITPDNYTNMDVLAREIETQLEIASAAPTSGANNTNYAVSYDEENSRFNIREDGTSLNELQILWSNTTGASTTAATLGYYPLDDTISYPKSDFTPVHGAITIDNTNHLLDFKETNTAGVETTLSAMISSNTYRDITELETAVENAMNDVSAASGNNVVYDVTYDDALDQFVIQQSAGTTLTGFDLLWNTGPNWDQTIGKTLGYDISADDTAPGMIYTSDTAPVLATFDDTNNVIEFTETNLDGSFTSDIRIDIPTGDYTDLDDVAAQIETLMRNASPNGVNYAVSYDFTAGQFMIKGSHADIRGFDLLWSSGTHSENSAAGMLGFDPSTDDVVRFSESDEDIVNLVIDGNNNKIDFREIMPEDEGKTVSQLTAEVRQKTYTSYADLSKEVEIALEKESMEKGNKIDYSVFWDDVTRRFTIKEDGTQLAELHLQWETGENADLSVGGTGQTIGGILGFNPEDDIETPMQSTAPAEWGIFNTLMDLKTYLAENDVDGISRSIGRLEMNFDNMTSRIVDTGMKYSRLQIRETITTEISLSMKERKSMIEDADIIEAIMNLQNIQTAYQAALSSTSRILNLSLVDYLR
jgi:flagellar hook-associated protein 3